MVESPAPNPPARTMRTGLWLFPSGSARELVDAVVAAEEGGFDEVWIADEGVMREPLVVLSAASQRTTRIRLGIGITTPALRHPGALGSSIATLDELSDGRAILGLGVGGALTLDPLGIEAERPVRMMRDAIRVARAVITREAAEGYAPPTHAMPARQVPIFVASRGEQINRLASRDADGVFLAGIALDRISETIRWAHSVRPVDLALFPSARFREADPADSPDAAALSGSPGHVAELLVDLAAQHVPTTIGLCLVDGDELSTMVRRAVETIERFRR